MATPESVRGLASSPCQAPPGYWGEDTLSGLLQAIVSDPLAEDRWQVLGDWLEEHDDPRRAELLRLHRRLLATCCEPERHPERAEWHARVVELLAAGVKPCVPQKTVVLPGVEMAFGFIPPGAFLMGSPEDEGGRSDDETLHRVTLSRGFWLGVTPVTQVQWHVVMGSNPSPGKDGNHPAEGWSWDACQAFCHQLGFGTGEKFRLPTEAEWEYACRAGSTTAFYTGDGPEAMKAAGWFNFDGTWGTGKKLFPGYLDYGRAAKSKLVGQFDPNAWGLYDMHGNVWEWCRDWYSRRQPEEAMIDPAGPDEGTQRVLRGGSYINDLSRCRSASRVGFEPYFPKGKVGCRVVLCPD